MARFYPTGGGGGGVSSSELTALKVNVLAGMKAVTSDSNDEVAVGQMPNYMGTSKEASSMQIADDVLSMIVKDWGAYNQSSKLTRPASELGNAINAQVLEGATYSSQSGLNKTGTLPDKSGTTNTAVATLDDTNKRVLLAVAITGKYDTNSKLFVPYASLANVLGLTAAKLVGGNTVLGVAGTALNDATIDAASDLLGGVIAYGKNGVKYTGTALNDATIDNANDLMNGVIAYGKNGTKYTGNVVVQSVLSFSAAPYSSNQITFTWKNPAKGPFSGVIIVGKTGSYPTSITDGTRWYKGTGNNSAASGTSSTTVSGFTSGTTYYFRCFSYAVKNDAEWVHGTTHTGTAATTKGIKTFTASETWTVPANVRSIDIFCVGGGGATCYQRYCGGAGGGYTATKKAYAVTPGQQFVVTIGAGATRPNSNSTKPGAGGTTSFGTVLSAAGGNASAPYNSSNNYYPNGGSGGSGGGGISRVDYWFGSGGYGNGGSDGGAGAGAHWTEDDGDGNDEDYYTSGGAGQGTTTRAFGETSNTLYAGGGGGSTRESSRTDRGMGGSGGGGNSGGLQVDYSASSHPSGYQTTYAGKSGTANTGGGAGGAGGHYAGQYYEFDDGYDYDTGYAYGASGGSGICIVRWGY